jgi:transcriptional regulator with XRE-family HTH domain
VNDLTVGRAIQLLRRRRRWRQRDLADRAGVSQATVSALERGQIDCTPLRTVRMVLDSLDATAWLEVTWRGGIIARLLDERHAALVGAVAESLTGWRWDLVPELSYSEYGERGSIDLVAWHLASRTLLVVEVKTELVSVEATLRKLDEKVRLGPRIVGERLGWRAAVVARLLVLPSDRAQRRHVERHGPVLDRALPIRGRAIRAWLRDPRGPVAGLWFVSTPEAAPPRTNLAARRGSGPTGADTSTARRRASSAGTAATGADTTTTRRRVSSAGTAATGADTSAGTTDGPAKPAAGAATTRTRDPRSSAS